MNFPLRAAAFAALVALSAPALATSSPPSIDGRYVDSGGYVQLTVEPCGDAQCGFISKIIRRKPGEPTNDVHNDNPALRSRSILGIRILKGLKWDDGYWRGKVYNPQDGNTYRALVRPLRSGALEVKGCLAIFCRTRIWPHVTP